jgi:hypothetical protein
MSNIKYSQQYVENSFKDYGLILNDIYKNGHTPLYCYDEDGYEYMERLPDVLKGKGHSKVHKGNPFSISNIKRYLKYIGSTLILLEEKYNNSSTNMSFQCECGTIFNATWNSIIRGKRYCNFCSKSKRWNGYRNYTKEIKDYCEYMDYILITQYINRCFDSFEYICNKHEEKGLQHSNYDQMINSNRGCYYCGIESRGISQRLDENIFKELIVRVGFIYVGCDYNNENSKYKKVNINYLCPNHIDKGIQTIKYNNLLVSNGKCQYCIGRLRTKEDLQTELDKLHNTIDILEYTDYSSPILSKCRICGHEWETHGVILTQGHRCPYCSKSNFALAVSSLLDSWGYKYKDEFWYTGCRDILPLPFDFYLSDFNILIEADGEGHYIPIRRGTMTDEETSIMFEKIKLHDEIKTNYCKENNIPLIRIPYWEKDNLKYYLWDKLLILEAIEEIAV